MPGATADQPWGEGVREAREVAPPPWRSCEVISSLEGLKTETREQKNDRGLRQGEGGDANIIPSTKTPTLKNQKLEMRRKPETKHKKQAANKEREHLMNGEGVNNASVCSFVLRMLKTEQARKKKQEKKQEKNKKKSSIHVYFGRATKSGRTRSVP